MGLRTKVVNQKERANLRWHNAQNAAKDTNLLAPFDVMKNYFISFIKFDDGIWGESS